MILLKHETDSLVPQRGAFLRLQMMHRGSIQKKFAAPAVIVHPENVQQRRFARARRAHDRNEFAFSHIEIDVAQDIKHLPFRERINAFEMAKFDHGRIRHCDRER